MPIYYYQALDNQGKKRKGFVEASNEQEAKGKLRDQGVMVTQLTTKASLSSGQNLSGDDLVSFTILLSQLVSAGIPLYESLLAIEEQYRSHKFHRIILSLCEQVKAGQTLSEAMSSFPQSFDKLYTAMVGSGEAAGALDIVLERLSQLLVKQQKLRKEIGTAMIYPLILGSFAFLVILMLLGFVIPSIEGIFQGRQLNAFTQFVLNASHFFREYWWAYTPVLIAGIMGIVYYLKTPKGNAWLQRTLLKVPLVKTLIVQAAIARFTRTMATLLQGGLSMINALRLSREVMQNPTIEEEIERAEKKIIEGGTLSVELKKSRIIPHLVSSMMAVGEESGKMTSMLNRIADMYEEDMEKTLQRVLALAQPVILIVMGTVIGLTLLAVLLPMTDLSSLSQQ